MRIIGFFIIFFVIMVVPSSAQTPPPSGDFGYDDFDHPLPDYTFWTPQTSSTYISGTGQLQILGVASQRLTHTTGVYRVGSAIRMRFMVSVETATFTYFRICGGNPKSLALVTTSIQGQSILGTPYDCFDFRFTGIGGDSTPNDVDFTVYLARPTNLAVEFWSDAGNIATVDYFDFTCRDAILGGNCAAPQIVPPTQTLVIAPTGIPRTTPTAFVPTALAPIGLIPPPSVGGYGEPDCGVYQCGAVSQSFPVLPPLLSPTALSLSNTGVTQVPLVTTVAEYADRTPVASDNGGGDDLGGYIAGDGVLRPNDPTTGDPIEVNYDSILPSDNSLFIAYIKGIYSTDSDFFGPFAPIVQVSLAVFSLLLLVGSGRFILPLAIILIGLIRKAWGALMDVIPF
jgi:hypothetical protein